MLNGHKLPLGIVKVIFQNSQLEIFQGSKINDLWETGRSPIKKNIFDSFWQNGIDVFEDVYFLL